MRKKTTPIKRRPAPDVTNVISSREVVVMTTGIFKEAEVREQADGSWKLFYPDPGFNPCNCSKKCAAETSAGPKMIEAHYEGATEEAVLAEAAAVGYLTPKVIPMETQSERMKRIHAERRERVAA